eukprot:CAMPEP_0168821404 /NCGR_PEP_ID=MMETSP0726-20121227/9382_1 /TAXON_ID=265536 /ORGANISM="Amphiprora sp., Strain CCMP467" /LENGTH=52 /DNA_ID=CAMNT_0008874015 /DNA_START=245 /DNA_END=400 /DNA_ORIENTATION=+
MLSDSGTPELWQCWKNHSVEMFSAILSAKKILKAFDMDMDMDMDLESVGSFC